MDQGDILKRFGNQLTKRIEDVTPFVKQQKNTLDDKKVEDLLVPSESTYLPSTTHCARE